jgi:phosphoadenosine phosphosulfate reductase
MKINSEQGKIFMITMTNLEEKIKYSIELIKRYEKMALSLNSYGYHLAFSGGKDSQIIYNLALKSRVKFKAYFYKTSVDPPELLKFIRENYKDVIWIKPEKTMFQLIEQRGLPTRKSRFCCDFLKERNGLNSVIITGVRKSESIKRRNTKTLIHECKLGQDKFRLNPILEWTDKEVWKYLAFNKIEVCELYKTQKRIGCVGCPINPKSQKRELELHPNFKKAYLHAIKKRMQYVNKKGKHPFEYFEDENECFEWWLSNLSVKEFLANKKRLELFKAND